MSDFNQEEKQLFEALSNCSVPVYFFAGNMKTNIAHWSKPAQKFFGVNEDSLDHFEKLWTSIIHPEDREKCRNYLHSVLGLHNSHYDLEFRVMTSSGKYEWILCSSYIYYDEYGNADHTAGFIRPLGYENKIDPVSNLRSFHEFRNNLSERLKKNDRGAILCFDLLNFKKIIDDYGYAFGDKFLYSMGALLKQSVHKEASIFRMQGSNFSIIIKSCKKADIQATYQTIQNVLRCVPVDGIEIDQDFVCTATIFPSDGVDVDRLQQNLFYGIEFAKTTNHKELVYYSDELYLQKTRQSQLREAIKKSLQNQCEGFELYFQPIVNSDGGNCSSAEALLRFSTPELGMVSPGDFIPMLEHTEDIVTVGAWVIDSAMRTLAEWRKINGNIQQIHVNVSSIQFCVPGFKDYVFDILKKYDLPGSALVLELTESCRIKATEEFAALFREFKEGGVYTALDDFGTGYASLIVLCDIPVDILKIDFQLTQNFVKYPQHRTILTLVSDFCKKGAIRLCAEGVETENSLSVMKDAGAELIQGFLISRPIPAEEFKKKFVEKVKVN